MLLYMEFNTSLDAQSVLLLIWLFVFLFYVFYSAFLIYHWHAYGLKKRLNRLSTIVYLAGSGIMLLVMALIALSV